MITKIYLIYTQAGEYVERISIRAETEDDCQIDLEAYLDTKKDCYGFEEEG